MTVLSGETCPRCRGRMLQAEDVDGPVQTCFACGFARQILYAGAGPGSPVAMGSASAMPSESHPTHGKGQRRFRL